MASTDSQLATLTTVIKQGINNRLKDVHTAMPGIIVSFDAVTQLATVQPAIKRIFIMRDGEREILTPSDLPLLINVLVVFPRGGGFSLTFPVKTGDECLLTFCERAIDDWHRTGKVSKPNARRFHSLSDATAFVGMSSSPNKVPSYDPNNVQLKADNGSSVITVQGNGILNFKATTSVTVDSPDTIITGNLDVQGSTTLTSDVTSNGVDISDTHKHAQANDSAGDNQQLSEVPQ